MVSVLKHETLIDLGCGCPALPLRAKAMDRMMKPCIALWCAVSRSAPDVLREAPWLAGECVMQSQVGHLHNTVISGTARSILLLFTAATFSAGVITLPRFGC